MNKSGINRFFNKALLIIAYIAASFLTIGACLKLTKDAGTDIGEGCIAFGILFLALLLLLEIPSVFTSIFCNKNRQGSLTAYNMKYKLYHIPYFLLTVFAWVTIFIKETTLGTDGIIFIAVLLVFTGYLIVLRFSISNLVYIVNNYRLKKMKPNVLSIIAIIMSFIFCVDVIGAVILNKEEINQNPDYFEIKKEEYLNYKHKLETGLHMNPIVYYVVSVILTITLCIPVGNILYLTFSSLLDESTVEAQILLDMVNNDAFMDCLIIAFVISLCKTILSFIYGKLGKKSPLKFICISKIIDTIPTLGLLVASGIFLYEGTKIGLFGFLLLPFMIVIVVFFAAIALIGMGMFAYAFSGGLFATAYLTIMGSTLSVFTYYIDHRKIENKKFASIKIKICMVLLWIPIADIVALILLRKYEKQDKIFGEKPLIAEL